MSNLSSFLDLCIKYGYLSNSFRCYNCDDNGKIDLLPYRLLITHRYQLFFGVLPRELEIVGMTISMHHILWRKKRTLEVFYVILIMYTC